MTRKGLTDEYLQELTKPASATMRVLQHSAQVKGVSQSLKAQSIFSFKRIRSICVSRAPLIQCSSSEVLNHPGEATKAPSRRDIEEHRRSVGICLVNNSGLVFAARLVSPALPEKDSVFHCLMKLFHPVSVFLPISAMARKLLQAAAMSFWCWCPQESGRQTWYMADAAGVFLHQ